MVRFARKLGPLFGTFCLIAILISCSISTFDTTTSPLEDDDPYLLATPVPPETPGGPYSVRLEWWPRIDDEILIHRFRGTEEDQVFKTNASAGMFIDTAPMDTFPVYEYRVESVFGRNRGLIGRKALVSTPSDCLVDNENQNVGFSHCHRIIVKEGTTIHASEVSIFYQAQEIHFLGAGATIDAGYNPEKPTAYIHFFSRRAKGRLKILTAPLPKDPSSNYYGKSTEVSIDISEKSELDLTIDVKPDAEGKFATCHFKNGPDHFIFTPKGRFAVADLIGVYEDTKDPATQYVLTHDLLLLTFWKRNGQIMKRGEKPLAEIDFSPRGEALQLGEIVARRDRNSLMAKVYALSREINQKLHHEGIYSNVEFIDGIWAVDEAQLAIVSYILENPKWVVRYLHRTEQNRIGFTTLQDQVTFMKDGRITVKEDPRNQDSGEFTRGLIFPPGLKLTPQEWMRKFRAELLSVKSP